MPPTLNEIFYQTVILECSLIESCRQNGKTAEHISSTGNDPLLSRSQAFEVFVNEVAQICDNTRGGSTITGVVILQGPEGPEYVFASNKVQPDGLQQTKCFLHDVFNLVAQNPGELAPKRLTKQVLWRILYFNLPRVGPYIYKLDRYLAECISDCQRRDSQDGECRRL